MITKTLPQVSQENWNYDGRPVPATKEGLYYLIDGEIKEWRGPSQEIKSCIFYYQDGALTRPTLGEVPLFDENEVMAAVESADKAWDHGKGEWPTMPVEKRIAAVEKFIDGMRRVRGAVIEQLMWEIGKTEADSIKEFDRTVQYIEDTIEALKDLDRQSTQFKIEGNFLAQIRRTPIGVTLCMGPYNYPLNETFTTMIPALIMGNPVISKLPRFGQLFNVPLLHAFQESFPKGVVNIINGRGNTVIPPILKSGRVHSVSFIGSSKTADVMKNYHPMPHRLRTVLSLDAKNLGVILEDADMNMALPELVAGALGFNGQRCTAIKMIFVHESRKDELISKFSEAISNMKAGFPWTQGVKLTPVADLGAVKFLMELLEDAKAKGAQVMNPCGGEHVENYIHPTILYPVTPEMRIYHVEQFGPLIPVCSFKEVDEVVDYVVYSDFGQQVSLFGYDPKSVGHLIDVLVNQVSRVNLNTQSQRSPDTFPFTGRKASAEGTLSVYDALERFSLGSLVATNYAAQPNRELIEEILRQRTSTFLRRDFIL
jgi:glyceraldehyde-3-phosphate dehydrogenase (NADP+)